MKIKIWGARGSTPAPVKPEVIKDKIAAAMLGLAQLEETQRQELLALLAAATPAGGFASEEERQAFHHKRRQAVEQYLANHLSPLVAGTAGGNTPCIEIRSGSEVFIIDAGSGIRELGMALMQGPCGQGQGVIHLLFSHPHWDHIQGFPFFRPAFIPGNQIFIYGVHDMETALRRQQEFISFPISLDYMQAAKTFIALKPEEVLEFGDLRIRNICNYHPGDAYGFRFEKGNKAFVYVSDASYPEGADLRPHLNFFAEADVLIFDAQFTQRESDEKEDWGHSSSFVGLEMAQQAKVKNLVLFHYDPTYSDQDLEKILDDTLKFQQNQYPTAPPVNVMIAQEGQTFDLTSAQSAKVQQVPGSKVAILKPAGVFDEQMAAKLREHLTELIEQDQLSQTVIDMSAVEMLQVAGLRGLVKLRKEQPGIPMALAAPSNNVQQLIELVGYLDFFAIYPSVHAALNALKARETLHLPGQVLKQRYKIEHKIGDGRLGTVFKARDMQDDRPVAIKILSPSFSETAIEQFLRQARQIVNLAHPNIVAVYDCDEDRGLSLMAEEYFESRTLQETFDRQRGQPLPFSQALSIAQGIVQALEYAHDHGVVHGDLKPENVLLGQAQVKISDFGLGRLEGGKALINIDVPLPFISARYLAPEQILGQAIDARTDLYALGAILYELFTGAPIFQGTDQEIIEAHRHQLPQAPRQLNPRLSRSLEYLILKLLEKDPAKRYASVRQVRLLLNSMVIAISRQPYAHAFAINRQPALTGRTAMMARLAELWRETRQGRGQVVLLPGPAGVGKTRLAHELVYRCREATVLLGDFPNMEGCPPYSACIRALENYFNNTPPDTAASNVGLVWQTAIEAIPELGRLPLRVQLPPVDDAPAPAGAGLAHVLADATGRQPWLVIFDDLQWADTGSLRLLAYLASHSLTMPLMIVGTYDDSQTSKKGTGLGQMLDRLRRQPNCTNLPVTPLTGPDTRRMLETIWSPLVPEELCALIHSRTGGNPLFIETLALNMIDENVVSWQENRWRFNPVIEMKLPQQIEEAIQQRLGHLSRETQALLSQAAVLGPVFSYQDLFELSDLSEWDALESIDIALQRQLLQIAPGEKILHFSHPLTQRVLFEGLSALKQRLIHREAGEALERQHLPQPQEAAGCLGYHFFNAGELERGLSYSIQAAEQARAMHVVSQALFWYSRALDILEQVDIEQSRLEQRFDLLQARVRLYHLQGARRLQQGELASLQQVAQALNDPHKQALAHQHQAHYEYLVGNIDEAETELQAGLIAARQVNNPVLESQGLIQLAHLALHRGQFDQAREHLYAAQQAMTNSHDDDNEAQRLNGLGLLYQHLGDFTESEQYFQQAIARCQATPNREKLARYLHNLGNLLLQTGRYSQALNRQQQALNIAQIVGHMQVIADGYTSLSHIYATLGDWQTAQTYVAEAKALHHQIEDEQGLARDLRLLGMAYLVAADHVSARDHLGQALEIFQHSKNKPLEKEILLELAMALEGLEHFSKAAQAYQQMIDLAEHLESRSGVPDARAGLARCLLAQGRPAEALVEVKTGQTMLTPAGALWRVRYPVRFYLTVYWVRQANKDTAQALAALRQGYRWLRQQAETIAEPRLKHSFLDKVPENLELIKQMKLQKTEEAHKFPEN